MGKGFEILFVRSESGVTYVLGRNKYQYAIGTMVGEGKKPRPIWKRYVTDTNIPEGVTLDECVAFLFSSRNPLKEEMSPIIKAHIIKQALFNRNNHDIGPSSRDLIS